MKQEKNNGPKTCLVTMALPYANGDIHLGHLVEAVQTDVYVRFRRSIGDKVVYICADDTHGTPIELSAIKQGITPEELIGRAHENHRRDYKSYGIGFDIFYTTNSPENRHYAELIFKALQDKDLIVEREIEQFYCEHDKRFLPDRFIVGTCPRCGAKDQYGDVCESCGATYEPSDLVQPRCRLCDKTPIRRTSRHLFVDLKKEETFLTEYLNTSSVLQTDMRNFVNNWITDGLKEWCISRDGPYFGFEIPGYPGKYFYVWLDAPIGYLSSTARWCADNGTAIDTLWDSNEGGEIVHFIGKDIVYFHTLFWPVMLRNAGFKLPSRFFIHGFLNVQGEKMSKTRGTFILAQRFAEAMTHPQATEYLRFYFAAKLSSTTADIDLNVDDFCTRVNTTLVNNVGNLHNRTFVFAQRYFDNRIPDADWDRDIEHAAMELVSVIRAAYEQTDYKTVVEKVHALGSIGNKYYQDNKPWKLVKADKDAAAVVIVTCANLVRTICVMLKPIVPNMVSRLEMQLGGAGLSWEQTAFSVRNVPLGVIDKLVTPIEPEQFDAILGEVVRSGVSEADTPPAAEDDRITIDQFQNVRLAVGTVASAEKLAKSKKLLKLQVNLGTETRQILAGIALHYAPEDIIGRQVVVVANLKPARLMGEISEGMVLAAGDGTLLTLVRPDKDIAPGSGVA